MSDPSPPSGVEPTSSPVLQVRLRSGLRDKLPEILVEGASVLLAILLAFAVDQWREERSHKALALRARETILAELRANRDELRGILTSNSKIIDGLQEQIGRLEKGEAKEVSTSMSLAQLSGAAFHAAQSTQALQFVDFDWLVLVGRTYEIQRTYTASQEAALFEVGGASGAIESGDKPRAVLHRINSRLTTVQQLGDGLMKAYDEVLSKK